MKRLFFCLTKMMIGSEVLLTKANYPILLSSLNLTLGVKSFSTYSLHHYHHVDLHPYLMRMSVYLTYIILMKISKERLWKSEVFRGYCFSYDAYFHLTTCSVSANKICNMAFGIQRFCSSNRFKIPKVTNECLSW